ncbi:hypothetical protein N9891_01085 [bacterium]|nr:hypothetical protein [bacterium]
MSLRSYLSTIPMTTLGSLLAAGLLSAQQTPAPPAKPAPAPNRPVPSGPSPIRPANGTPNTNNGTSGVPLVVDPYLNGTSTINPGEEGLEEKPELETAEPNVLKPEKGTMFVTGAVQKILDGGFTLGYEGRTMKLVAHPDMKPEDSEKLTIGEHVLAHVAIPPYGSEDEPLKTLEIEGFDNNSGGASDSGGKEEKDDDPLIPVTKDSYLISGSILKIDGDLVTLDTGQQNYTVDLSDLNVEVPNRQAQREVPKMGAKIEVVVPLSRELFAGGELRALALPEQGSAADDSIDREEIKEEIKKEILKEEIREEVKKEIKKELASETKSSE